jgi:hypothetical protein
MSITREEFYERLHRPIGDLTLPTREQDVLCDEKWKIFIRLSRRLRHVPFVEFALAAGSMALGNVKDTSDFDVIVGAHYGRVFTARAFCIVLFGFFGERTRRIMHHEEGKDKICFNHFVTEKSYRLNEPHNLYWQELYKQLVPLYGEPEKIEAFFKANAWMGERRYERDRRHAAKRKSLIAYIVESLLQGKVGDLFEKLMRSIQLSRIEHNLKEEKLGFEPRVIYSDEELEFHPDTKRIHTLLID